MLIYYIYFGFILVVLLSIVSLYKNNIYLPDKSKDQNYRNFFLYISIYAIWLIVGFRGLNVGTDTASYCYEFINIRFSEILNRTEPLYYLSVYIIRLFTHNLTVFLMIMALPFPIALTYIVKKADLNVVEIIIMIVTMFLIGIYDLYITGLRQMIAISILIFSYRYIKDRKLIKFLLLVIIAMLFHNSAGIFIIAYLVYNIKVGKKPLFLLLAFYLIGRFIPEKIIELIQYIFTEQKYSNYGTNYKSSISMTLFYILLLLLIFVYICLKKDVNDYKNRFYVNMMVIGTGFQSLTPVVGEFFRIAIYFEVFSLVLIPLSIRNIKNRRTRAIINIGYCVVCLLYIFIFKSELIGNYTFMQ